MVKLSVIIVNYNVKFFLQQAIRYALRSAEYYERKTTHKIELIVVDNNSSDDSIESIKQQFSNLIILENKENKGFSKANNQGIELAKGEYVLLLNPDTIVQEDTFDTCIKFMDLHREIGGLGVKMIDGRGIFLPESKRGLPSPKVALFKMLGISSIFKNSPYFNQYHLGHLDKDKNHEIEILSGAFMFMRKAALDKVGLLDETFFMYGEDIDLSYRIIKGGYKNFYLADTQIVHYKGESTKKGSLNYVRIFYNAMIIFARKHFSNKGAGFMILPIRIGIYLRAFIAILSRFIKRSALFIFDGISIISGMYWLKNLYAEQVKNNIDFFEPELMTINVPIYASMWLIACYFSGGYDLPFKTSKIIRGVLLGTLLISAIYGFLDEELRSSRALIVLGMFWAIFALSIIRKTFNLFRTGSLEYEDSGKKRIILLGENSSIEAATNFLLKVNPQAQIVARLTEEKNNENEGNYNDLEKMIDLFNADEIIFCEKDIDAAFILNKMQKIGSHKEYKIYSSTGDCIIGSNSKNTAGDFYANDSSLNLANTYHRRNKRVFDILSSLVFLICFPLLLFSIKGRKILSNVLYVLIGKKTWVAYDAVGKKLPEIKEGVFSCINQSDLSETVKQKLYLLYAQDYSVLEDIKILFKT